MKSASDKTAYKRDTMHNYDNLKDSHRTSSLIITITRANLTFSHRQQLCFLLFQIIIIYSCMLMANDNDVMIMT